MAKTEMKQVIQSYVKYGVALQGLPYDQGNTIRIGDKYVIAFRSDATGYTDVLSAYVITYTSNKHLGEVSELIAEYNLLQGGWDHSLEDLPITLLEWIDSDGTTATERTAFGVA